MSSVFDGIKSRAESADLARRIVNTINAREAARVRTCDLDALRDELDQRFDWSYIESEGPDTIRFDQRGGRSVWVMFNGSMYGNEALQHKIRPIVVQFTS